MPFEVTVDRARRLVIARASGVIGDADVFGYQHEVWSQPDVAGYDELVDMTGAEKIEPPPPGRVRALASLSAKMDAPGTMSRLAIVAPRSFAHGLGIMYEALRELAVEGATKEVEVFRSRDDAEQWLRDKKKPEQS